MEIAVLSLEKEAGAIIDRYCCSMGTVSVASEASSSSTAFVPGVDAMHMRR